MSLISKLLAHPLTRGMSVDDPLTTLYRRKIIQNKSFLRLIYLEWYELIKAKLPEGDQVLELGSGAGFLQEILPNIITSEIFETPGISLIADACQLPFSDSALDAIVMTDVLHHIPNVDRFFSEAERCIRPGGKIIMIEPWRSAWSEWVYKNLHPEPFEIESGWKIPASGPLSGANGALPWIVFERDRLLFESKYPNWLIKNINPIMPFSYLLSGGVSMRSLLPGFMYRPVRGLESIFGEQKYAMFALIELQLANV